MRIAALITVSGLALAGCTAEARDGEEGGSAQRSYALSGFDSVSLAGSPDVVVTVGPAFSVRAEGDARAIERLELRVEGSSLSIGTRNKRRWSMGFWRNHRPVTIHVTLPVLAAASLSGSGEIRVDRVQGERFSGSVAGSGDIKVENLRVREARFSVAGSGAIRAAGAAERTEISMAGSGDVDAGGLEAREATVSLVGSGDVRARATETARLSLRGSGDIAMHGPARCDVDKVGSGEVRCGA